jgi:hypothetical protein
MRFSWNGYPPFLGSPRITVLTFLQSLHFSRLVSRWTAALVILTRTSLTNFLGTVILLALGARVTLYVLGPSFKRGPPKGYIRAIESRWHQVESLLGAILQCPDPRVQSIVSDASYIQLDFILH